MENSELVGNGRHLRVSFCVHNYVFHSQSVLVQMIAQKKAWSLCSLKKTKKCYYTSTNLSEVFFYMTVILLPGEVVLLIIGCMYFYSLDFI